MELLADALQEAGACREPSHSASVGKLTCSDETLCRRATSTIAVDQQIGGYRRPASGCTRSRGPGHRREWHGATAASGNSARRRAHRRRPSHGRRHIRRRNGSSDRAAPRRGAVPSASSSSRCCGSQPVSPVAEPLASSASRKACDEEGIVGAGAGIPGGGRDFRKALDDADGETIAAVGHALKRRLVLPRHR